MRFGKRPRKSDYRTLRFSRYAKRAAPPPPAINVLERVETALKFTLDDVSTFFPMDANDQYGDCTIAAAAHAVTLYRALIGEKVIPNEQDVVDTYLGLAGGADNGLVMLDVLNAWRRQPIGGSKIDAYARLDPHEHDQVRRAIQLFGGAYLGFQVQQNAIADFEAGTVWTPGDLTLDGHAVFACGYDEETVRLFTWGDQHRGTWAWWDACVDEAYVVLPSEAQHAGFAPGFDFATLQADLHAITSSVGATAVGTAA